MDKSQYRNIILILFFYMTYLFTGYQEAQIQNLSSVFIGVMVIGFILNLLLCRLVSTPELLSYLVVGLFYTYIQESLGVNAGIWHYNSLHGEIHFGVYAWVTAALSVACIAKWGTMQFAKQLTYDSPWLNRIIVIAFMLMMANVLWLTDYLPLLIVMFIVGIYALLIASTFTTRYFLLIVSSGIMISLLGEHSGSLHANLFTFNTPGGWPPLYLMLGFWPVELLSIIGLSRWIANVTKERL